MTAGLHQSFARIRHRFRISQFDQVSIIGYDLLGISLRESLRMAQQVALYFIPNNVGQHQLAYSRSAE